jgi:hypothetical protein
VADLQTVRVEVHAFLIGAVRHLPPPTNYVILTTATRMTWHVPATNAAVIPTRVEESLVRARDERTGLFTLDGALSGASTGRCPLPRSRFNPVIPSRVEGSLVMGSSPHLAEHSLDKEIPPHGSE